MRKLLLLLTFAVSPLTAQDTIRIVHKNYTTVFSKSLKYPILVEWWVTKSGLECANPVARKDKFIPDPLLKKDSDIAEDYVGSGFDRGHLAPAADNRCKGADVMEESFFFTNMAPQYPGLNRGQWKNLEEWTRELGKMHDSVFVQAGCVGDIKKVKSLSIPSHCWKVITIKKTGEVTAYWFPNVPEKSASFEMHMIDKEELKKKLPVKIK
jgi:endonuclease G